jgi:iron complex outermembrane receptor protein
MRTVAAGARLVAAGTWIVTTGVRFVAAGAAAAEETAPAAAGSAAPPPLPAVVETIEVRGRPDEVDAIDATAFATVIRAEDFAGRVTTLPELLRAVVGVQISSLGGEFATVSIRGSAAEQVMVYLDGVPLNRALGGAVNLADLPLNQVESIAVYRGFTPAGLPAASIGGAILVTTRDGQRAQPGAGSNPRPAVDRDPRQGAPTWALSHRASATYGSFATAEATFASNGRHGGFDYSAGIDAGRSAGDFEYLGDGGTPANPADDGTMTRENNDFGRLHLAGRAGFRAGERGRVTLTTDLFRREQGVPGKGSASFEAARLDERRGLLRADLEVPGLLQGRILARAAADTTLSYEEFVNPIEGVGETTHTDNRMRSFGVEGSILWTPSARQGLTLYGSGRRETADLSDLALPDPDLGTAGRDTTALVVEDQIAIGGDHLVLNPSIRHDAYANAFRPGSGTALHPDSLDRDDAFTTGKIGIRARLSDAVTLRANAGRFVRLPSFTELFGYRGSIKGNPSLRPETGRNLDLGVALALPGSGDRRPGPGRRPARLEVAFFETVADDLILFWPNSQSVVFARNMDRARIRGCELSLGVTPLRRLEVLLNWTEQRAINESPTPARGNLLPGRPTREIAANATLAAGGSSLTYAFTYVSRNYVDLFETDSSALLSRYIHDLGWRRTIAPGLEMNLEIKNLTDEQTYDVAGFPLPGRSLQGKLAWTF